MTTQAHAVVDLGFGDSGKGTLVDYLARVHRTGLVVRFNGGSQAAHNVVEPSGREHVFSQFGSGTLAGAHTHMSRHTYVDPLSLVLEARHLQDIGIDEPFSKWTADPRCFVITPIHQELNRQREISRGANNRHGSCGRGFGEAVDYSLQWPTAAPQLQDLRDIDLLLWKFHALQEYAVNQGVGYEPINTARLATDYTALVKSLWFEPDEEVIKYYADEHVIFEGAQAVLIDERYGIPPYHTWSDCTFTNAQMLAGQAGLDLTRIGVTRTYMARHGRGPLPTESFALRTILTEKHNGYNKWQEQMRVGHLDLPLLKYSVAACRGVDELAVTHLDRTEPLSLPVRLSVSGDPWTEEPVLDKVDGSIISVIERNLGVDVKYTSRGPTHEDKEARNGALTPT